MISSQVCNESAEGFFIAVVESCVRDNPWRAHCAMDSLFCIQTFMLMWISGLHFPVCTIVLSLNSPESSSLWLNLDQVCDRSTLRSILYRVFCHVKCDYKPQVVEQLSSNGTANGVGNKCTFPINQHTCWKVKKKCIWERIYTVYLLSLLSRTTSY